MATKVDKQALWIEWARDAIGQYVMPEEVKDSDDLADDMVAVSVAYADSMLDEFEKRFEPGSARTVRGGAKRRKPKDEDEDGDED
jgi:hypothetical protein